MQLQILALQTEHAWSAWFPLRGCWKDNRLPRGPGLYRLRLLAEHGAHMAYIGQSGNLKERLYALRPIYDDAMPYAAPHVAGPSLWAWRHVVPDACFEASVAPLPGLPRVLRLGLETLAIALCRQHDCRSPLCQFGRMPEGYEPSSGNDARLVLSGKRHRGGPTNEILACHRPGVAPLGELDGDPHERGWCGHTWSPWVPLGRFAPVQQSGLYRLRVPGLDSLPFLGQGKIADRLKQIRASNQLACECSWGGNRTWLPHQRLELVTDLIAAHLLSTRTLPLWQFESSHPLDGEAPEHHASEDMPESEAASTAGWHTFSQCTVSDSSPERARTCARGLLSSAEHWSEPQ